MAKELANNQTDEADRVESYIASISQYDREFEKWYKRIDKITKRYRDESSGTTRGVKFNILWSNVQTLVPATFSQLPKPDVARRFRDNDPVGRVAALILERALEYEIEQYADYAESLKQSVQDRFLGGRGTTWVRYEPHFRDMEIADGIEVTEDVETEESTGEGESSEELDYECSPCDYVHPKDFGHSVARTWEEVTQVWRVVYMHEDSVKERFGEETAKNIPYDSSPDKKDKGTQDKTPKQAKIYEIWDKQTNTAIWLSKSLSKILDERSDPLKLQNFWPCPKPLFATITNDTLVPVPDFVFYQDQADELDNLSTRIGGLIQALQVKGTYDASVPELSRIMTEGKNTQLIPVKNWQSFVEKKGLQGAIDLIDLTPFANALKECYLAVGQIKEYIYEITGISDIVRGQTNANETLGAQQIKQNFVGLRLKTMQSDVAKFATELIKIKAQIICAKYSPQTIIKISAAEQLSEADQLYIIPAVTLLVGQARLQDPEADTEENPLSCFRVEVHSDSLVKMDEQQDKMDRMEFLKAAGSFIKDALPVVQSSPDSAPLMVQMLKFGVTGFKVGKTIEGDFDQALDKLKKDAAQPKQPQPNPDQIKIQADQQAAQLKMQHEQQQHAIEMQFEQHKLSMEAQARERDQQLKAAIETHKNEMDLQRQKQDQQHQIMLENMRSQAEESKASQLSANDRYNSLLKVASDIVTSSMSLPPEQQDSAAESAVEAMPVANEDADMLRETVQALLAIAQNTQDNMMATRKIDLTLDDNGMVIGGTSYIK